MKYWSGLIVGILCIWCNSAYAQVNWQWARSGGGKGSDQAYSIAADNVGNIYVAGFYTDSAIFTDTTIRAATKGKDYFLAKYSSTGSLIWVKTSRVKGASYATGVCISENKYIYLTGTFSDSVSFGSTLLTSNNLFLVKFDLDGNVAWARSENAGGGNLIKSVSSDAAGNAYLTGSFTGGATIGGIGILSAGGVDIFVAKYDPSGSVVWAKQFGSAGDDGAFAIATSSTGYFAITGYIGGKISFGAASLSAFGSSDLFVAKFSPDGNVVWAFQSGDTVSGSGAGIAMDLQGNVYVTGAFNGWVPDGCDGYGNIYIAKFNTEGSKVWAKCAGPSGEDYGNAITADRNGNIYITGQYDEDMNLGTGPIPVSGIGDMFIAEYNSSGTALWADHTGAKMATDFGNAVALDSAGELYVSGGFTDTMRLGPLTLKSFYLTDMFVTKIGIPLGVNKMVNASQALKLFPNPAASELQIELHPSGGGRIELYSLLGVPVRKINVDNGMERVSISLVALSPGTYLCRYTSDEGIESAMMVIR
jgi:hypothetical protein